MAIDYRIGYGQDFNFFKRIAVSATGVNFGPSADGYRPDIQLSFTPATVMFLNEGTGTVEYSFNGFTVHGELTDSNPSKQMIFQNRIINKIWFRVKSGSSGPINIRVDAWSIP